MADFGNARVMLIEFKGDAYIHGLGVLPQVGAATAQYGNRAALVTARFPDPNRSSRPSRRRWQRPVWRFSA